MIRVYILIVLGLTSSCGNRPHDAFTDVPVNANARNDSWGFVGFGGGGAMFHPAVSPHDPNFVFVACDMTGSYVTYDGGERWRMFNLKDPVDFFVFDPTDPNTVYANGIGLFKSTDRGNTWSLLYPHPRDVAGIVSRGDHATEVLVTHDSTRRDVQALAIDPENSNVLYLAASIDQHAGVFISKDGGASWARVYDLPDPAIALFVNPTSPIEDRTLHVVLKTGVHTRSNGKWNAHAAPDGVKQITTVTGGLDRRSNNFILYAISGKSYFNLNSDVSGIHYSDDGGVTWENREGDLTRLHTAKDHSAEWRSIATSALNAHVVYVSYNDLTIAGDTTCVGVAKSENYGRSWELVWKDRLWRNGHKVSDNYESGWINERFGPTWGENPFSLGVSATNPDICYGTDFGRTTKTEDGGASWHQVYTRKNPEGTGWISRGLEVTTSYHMGFDPFDENHIFIANTDIGLMESADGGRSWNSATRNNGVPRPWINSTYWLAFDPKVQGRAWAAMSGSHDLPRPKMFRRNSTSNFKGGILMTQDAGRSWTPVSHDIGEAAMTHVLIDETSDPGMRTLYACAFGKGVYKSTDGGKTWQQKNKGIGKDEPFAWRIVSRPADSTLFLVVARRSDDGSIGTPSDGALYRSDDAAETWTPVKLPEGTNGPTSLHSEKHGILLLSAWGRQTDGRFSPDVGGGIFRSNDDGESWRHVLSVDQHIHDITYDPRINVFYAVSFNGAAYRSEDEGATWMRIPGYNFKWGKRVDPDPRDANRIFIITFGGGVSHGLATGDSAALEDIRPPIPFLF